MSAGSEPPINSGNDSREAVFQERLARRRAENNQFPWSGGGIPDFEIPRDESKLFANRYIEDPTLSDDEVERRALLDLTGYNFWSFYKRLNYESRRALRYKRELSLLLVSIDGLSAIAAEFGMTCENNVVLSAGRILLGSIRDIDIAGRCRDDTFGVILPETPLSGAEVAAERIRTKMEEHIVSHETTRIPISSSVAGTCMREGDRVDLIVARAIEALKNCMSEGGNQIELV